MESLTLDSLNHKSEGLTERVEKLEKRSWVLGERKKPSEEVRSVFYKIQSLERSWNPDPRLKKQYDSLLSKYERLLPVSEDTETNQNQSFDELLTDLNSLVTSKWEKLTDKKMDWWIIEWVNAISDWVERALKKVFQEMADTLKLIVSPEDWLEIAKALKEVMLNPIEFVENMFMFLKEEYGHIVRDIWVIKDNSTNSWMAIEMWQYIPETCIPLIVSAIWQWKFVKILKSLKVDKLLPAKLMKRLEQAGKEKKYISTGPEMEDRLWKFEKPTRIWEDTLRQRRERMQRMEKIVYRENEFTELMKDPKKFMNFKDSLENMVDYLNTHMNDIKKMSKYEIEEQFYALKSIKNKIWDYKNKYVWNLWNGELIFNRLNNIVESNEFKKAYEWLLMAKR